MAPAVTACLFKRATPALGCRRGTQPHSTLDQDLPLHLSPRRFAPLAMAAAARHWHCTPQHAAVEQHAPLPTAPAPPPHHYHHTNISIDPLTCTDSGSGLTFTTMSVLPLPPRHGCSRWVSLELR